MQTSVTRWSWFRRLAFSMVALLLVAMLAACGGSDDDNGGGNSLPLVSGVTEIDKQEMPAEDMQDMGFRASNGEVVAYKSTRPYSEVSGYYTNGARDDGWNIGMSMPFGETTFAIMSKDKKVVIATVVSAAEMKSGSGFITTDDLDELNVNLDDFEDNDTLILLAHYTCDEDDVTTCMDIGI